MGFVIDKFICKGLVQTNRVDDGHHAGSFTCTSLLQKPTEAQKERVHSFSELHGECNFGPQRKGGTTLVKNTAAYHGTGR